jgi:hypothetical protein
MEAIGNVPISKIPIQCEKFGHYLSLQAKNGHLVLLNSSDPDLDPHCQYESGIWIE